MKKNELGYIELTLKQFLKNKLAVCGVWIILLLFFSAIYAPLIANNKPILIKTKFQDLYEDNFYALLSNIQIYIDNLDTHHPHSINKKANIKNLKNSFKSIEKQLFNDKKNELNQLNDKLFSSFNDNNTTQAKEVLSIINNSFNPEKVEIKQIFKFPALKNLSFTDIFFMLFFPLFFVLVILKNIFRKKYAKIKAKRELIFCAFVSIAGAVIYLFLSPPFFDTSPYKEIIKNTPVNEIFYAMPPIPYGENENIISQASQKPSWLIPATEQNENYHVLGTDTTGRDVLCRMVWGTRISMSVGFIAVGICFIIGVFFGSLAGYFRGWVDISISRLIEIVICFPVFFLILTVLAFLRPSIFNIMVVIGITGWTGIARLCRGEFLKLVKQDFVTAATALGASNMRIIFKHILPNGLGPVLVAVSFGIAGAILTESALSFLGFGVPQPTASWGDLLNNGRNNIQGTWWLTIFPGLAIFVAVTAFNLAGEGLRDALDPRLKRE